MRRTLPRTLPAVALLFVLAGCGDDPAAPGGTGGTGGGAAPAAGKSRPKCADVFQPGKKIVYPSAEGAQGCADAKGDVRVMTGFECRDGRFLFQIDASTGAKPGYGYRDGTYQAIAGTDVTGDEGYQQAYEACTR
ncbi:hypothetical protein ABZS66_49870 [Dactylosporangium sp. NPDC005572]|uniref:hypothetical protein n=1 Tax=Dactylosporangium sp. NPDC005572 TaxID=3156889 RepID=UPI0033BA7CCD